MLFRKNNIFLFIIILIGLLLRLVWTSDMEWKDDEQQMFAMAHEAAGKCTLPSAGMRSGGGIVNPGMSVGPFAVIAMFTSTPVAMNRAVQIINVVSILCFLMFMLLKVEQSEKEIWLSGIALAAISPLTVLFSRKIWAQDLLPIFSFVIIFANANRRKGWGAFVWGLTGALIGQLHMSGFFFAAGLFVFTVIYDFYYKQKFRWIYWLAGSVIGSVTLIPWIIFLLHNPQVNRQAFIHIFQFSFYVYWFLDSQGLNIYYSLRNDFWQLIKEPVLFGVPTYLVAISHIFLVAASFYTIIWLVKFIKKIIIYFKQKTFIANLFANISITKFYLLSILLGLGVFMTLSGSTIYTHYIICAFPFQYIFLAKILEKHKILFRSIIIAQLIITMSFLVHIHNNNGALNGNYGKTYKSQIIK